MYRRVIIYQGEIYPSFTVEPRRGEGYGKCRFPGPGPDYKIKIYQVKIQILYSSADSMILIHVEIGDPLVQGHFIIPQECIRYSPFRLIDTFYSVVRVTGNFTLISPIDM